MEDFAGRLLSDTEILGNPSFGEFCKKVKIYVITTSSNRQLSLSTKISVPPCRTLL
jgi:hypothetical protein